MLAIVRPSTDTRCASWRGERADLDRLLRRYYVACGRRIWKLLPMDESRRCVETVDRHLVGDATDEELRKAEWQADGAAVILQEGFENLEPGTVARCIEEVEAMAPDEFAELLAPVDSTACGSARNLLAHAGYHVVLVACYPDIEPIDHIEPSYGDLLSAALLREILGGTAESP